jgi:hypothetical protein
MKALIIIRTYPIDDYISYLCYQSFKRFYPNAKYIFFAQNENDPPPGKYYWITQTGEEILIRPYCCNFGGKSHVEGYVEGLKKIDTTGFDKIVCSDADITILKDIFENDFDLGGVKHFDYDRLYSGQLLIFSKEIFDRIVAYPDYPKLYDYFIENGLSISDDMIFSWLATEWTEKRFDFYNKGYWNHEKLHHLEPLQ